MSLRIALVDDHAQFRINLKLLLQRQGFEVVMDCEGGLQGLQTLARLVPADFPDVVVMDVAMPGMSGQEATRRVMANWPHARVLALSMHDDTLVMSAMASAGALGYLCKDASLPELLQAVHNVAVGRRHFPEMRDRAELGAASPPRPPVF